MIIFLITEVKMQTWGQLQKAIRIRIPKLVEDNDNYKNDMIQMKC